jgi:hypothetical protein
MAVSAATHLLSINVRHLAARLMLHADKILQLFFMGTQQEKIMGLEGFFMGWIMGDEVSEHSSACYKKVVRY